MKVLVTGVGGQLGYDVMNELAKRDYECIGSDILESTDSPFPYVQLDITDKYAVEKALAEANPDVVVHCAAWTAVDAAEDEENKPKVYAVNVTGTKNIAEACKKLGCKLIYISTDYVFNGQGTEPWKADCKDFAPLNYYGQTKLEGELAVSGTLEKFFIVRNAWVFGQNGNNFTKTMISVGKKYDTVRVVNDPTKIHTELGWFPETKFEDGIKKTIKWYLDNKEWWQEIISGEYQNYYEKMYGNR